MPKFNLGLQMQRLKTSPNEKAAETLVDAIDPEDKFEFASVTTISERKIPNPITNGEKTFLFFMEMNAGEGFGEASLEN